MSSTLTTIISKTATQRSVALAYVALKFTSLQTAHCLGMRFLCNHSALTLELDSRPHTLYTFLDHPMTWRTIPQLHKNYQRKQKQNFK